MAGRGKVRSCRLGKTRKRNENGGSQRGKNPVHPKVHHRNDFCSPRSWLPSHNVARHAVNLRGIKTDGVMLGWTLGGYPSPNLEVVAEALAGGSAEDVILRVAERRVGKLLAAAVVTAWGEFSTAFQEFPYHIGVAYSGPQQLGPANLLWAAPTGYHASMVGFPYDDLDAWRAIYPPEIFISQLEKVAFGFERALQQFKNSTVRREETLSKPQRQALQEELSVAEAATLHFRSAANQARFVVERRAFSEEKDPVLTALPRAKLESVLQQEIILARRLHALQSRDARLGFEASNHYFYIPVDLAEKVLNCRDLLDRWLPR